MGSTESTHPHTEPTFVGPLVMVAFMVIATIAVFGWAMWAVITMGNAQAADEAAVVAMLADCDAVLPGHDRLGTYLITQVEEIDGVERIVEYELEEVSDEWLLTNADGAVVCR